MYLLSEPQTVVVQSFEITKASRKKHARFEWFPVVAGDIYVKQEGFSLRRMSMLIVIHRIFCSRWTGVSVGKGVRLILQRKSQTNAENNANSKNKTNIIHVDNANSANVQTVQPYKHPTKRGKRKKLRKASRRSR